MEFHIVILALFSFYVIECNGSIVRTRRETCGSYVTQVDSTMKEQILNLHNNYRSKVGNAVGMRKFVWSDALAERAQAWAESCTVGHGLMATCDGKTLGQNGVVSASSTINVQGYVDGWYSEINNFNAALQSCPTGSVCGHYIQLMFDESYEIGCGYKICPSMTVNDGETWTNAASFWCNYYPGMHYRDSKLFPFITGTNQESKCQFHESQLHGGKSSGGLCIEATTPGSEGCNTCNFSPKACSDHGTVGSDCKCTCDAKFQGGECQYQCEDHDEFMCQFEVMSSGCTEGTEGTKKTCPKQCQTVPPECK